LSYTRAPQYSTAHTDPVLLRDDYASLCDLEDPRGRTVPGMITPVERNALYQIGSQYRGVGKIIDAGCFLGASTSALASGLVDSGAAPDNPKQPVIHSYDLGVLPKSSNPKAPATKRYEDFEYVFGQSFVPELRHNIREHAPFVQLHIGDILEQRWSNTPIEICFLDICKTIAIDAHVAQMFFGSFVAGTTVLVQQDYFFHRLPWIKVTLGLLAEHFEWLGRVEFSSIYRCTSVPSAEQIPDLAFRDYELESLLKFHRFACSELLDERTRFQLDVSEMYLVALKKSEQRALDGLKEISHRYRDTIAVWDAESKSSADAPGDATRLITQAERQIRTGHVHKVSW